MVPSLDMDLDTSLTEAVGSHLATTRRGQGRPSRAKEPRSCHHWLFNHATLSLKSPQKLSHKNSKLIELVCLLLASKRIYILPNASSWLLDSSIYSFCIFYPFTYPFICSTNRSPTLHHYLLGTWNRVFKLTV